MKNLYKKTSAILLTGAVTLGGFVVSGLNVHANTHTTAQERDIQRVTSCCKGYGDVCVMDSKRELDESVKGYSRTQIANNGHIIEVRNTCEIPRQIQDAKRYNKELVEVQYRDLYYLIDIN